MGTAQLKFTDGPDRTMSVEATHDGEFDPSLQSHACLRAVSQFLPQVLAPAGTRLEGDIGNKTPTTDGDRYQALRALALMPEDQHEAINKIIGADGDPRNESEFDALADKLVMIARGMPVPLGQPAAVTG